MIDLHKVLFLCHDNAALSIMAEALLREIGGERFRAYSAGWEPASCIDDAVLAQLRPGVSAIHLLNPKSWLEFTGEWAPRLDCIVMCEQLVDRPMLSFPGQPAILHWNLDRSFANEGADCRQVRASQKTFWQIVRLVDEFCARHKASKSAARVRHMDAARAMSAGS